MGTDSRNAYLLATDDDPIEADFQGKWIWKLNVMPKIQVFLWKCILESIPVKDVLSHRGLYDLSGCDFCLDEDESILHMLRDCKVAQSSWRSASCYVSLLSPFSFSLKE